MFFMLHYSESMSQMMTDCFQDKWTPSFQLVRVSQWVGHWKNYCAHRSYGKCSFSSSMEGRWHYLAPILPSHASKCAPGLPWPPWSWGHFKGQGTLPTDDPQFFISFIVPQNNIKPHLRTSATPSPTFTFIQKSLIKSLPSSSLLVNRDDHPRHSYLCHHSQHHC